MERHKILDELEDLQDKAYEQGFIGSNERELFYRESIADYILSKLNKPTDINISCIHPYAHVINEESGQPKCLQCGKRLY